MPYTPPAQHSPASSKPSSPSLSRSHSHQKRFSGSEHHHHSHHLQHSPNRSGRPTLPHSTSSTSYLSRHRRSPSASQLHSHAVAPPSPEESSPADKAISLPNGPAEQPFTNGHPVSPPSSSLESSESPSDDEGITGQPRGRKLENLEELQEAIRTIEQRRESSPGRAEPQVDGAIQTVEAANGQAKDVLVFRPGARPLSKEARKIAHSRSNTESAIILNLGGVQVESPNQSVEDSSDTEDSVEAERVKPPMVRKKSGELVKPALRPASRRRPSSMPGTPTYSKAVHFDSHLEHVRHFLKVDRPVAVSAGSSPVETFDSEMEFPFSQDNFYRSRTPQFEWEIRLSNFPSDSPERRALPVRVERVFLSTDNKTLVGSVAVANLAFHKSVVARFTFDYWKTTSEVLAEYNNDVRRKQVHDGYDRFNFNIKLADQANLENKTLFFCVRYSVNGQDFWDNNGSINYQVEFIQKAKPQDSKKGVQSAPRRSLPRSHLSSPPASEKSRASASSFDDFADGFGYRHDFDNFREAPAKIMGDSPGPALRFKASKGADVLNRESPARKVSPAGQAFGNRYDFGASLSAAIQAANTALGERSGIQKRDFAKETPTPSKSSSAVSVSGKGSQAGQTTATSSASTVPASRSFQDSAPKPTALTSEKPSIQSSSYHELLDKYCFFGSAKTSPQMPSGTLGQTDGANDERPLSLSIAENPRQSGASTPASAQNNNPSAFREDIKRDHARTESPRNRSTSPAPMTGSAYGTRTPSPVSFGYPYHQSLHGGIFSEGHTPTAILS
ncbi:carbohydrate-binding module family 21 protein [Xylona heveae TC161]|uniref:Carbohydrate-binding module family 21 protein n=1 Tax=Xylona heveae (strain CBS 132557 / TC161) TaxID=1328760 RepID=A0A165G2S1_XYLHT|nr:carbohydrate-binding module family 21 protein [Xylona heveae TC161]KZF21674.1 carbohydrate-binding module family 21 protein [Xylona heveae TC161]